MRFTKGMGPFGGYAFLLYLKEISIYQNNMKACVMLLSLDLSYVFVRHNTYLAPPIRFRTTLCNVGALNYRHESCFGSL